MTHINNLKFDIAVSNIQVNSIDNIDLGVRYSIIENLNHYMSINHQGMIVSKKLFDFISFDIKYNSNYDYIWTWKVLNIYYPQILVYNDTVGVMRLGGISERYQLKAATEIFLVKYKFNSKVNATINYVLFLIKFLIKKITPKILLKKLVLLYRAMFKSGDCFYK